MRRPELKQFAELEAEDFERHPVWAGCHAADSGKSWYHDTDEETFRPWTGELPADPARGIFLVRAVIELHDGTRHSGFVTPAAEEWDKGPDGRPAFKHTHILGTQQPHMFVGEQQFGFWGGMLGVSAADQRELYAALGKSPNLIFPLTFTADPGLAKGLASGQVEGFYRQAAEGIQVSLAQPVDEVETDEATGTKTFFQMSAKTWQGYPKPGGADDFVLRYKKVVYSSVCTHCGIYDKQVAPFRFGKSDQKELAGFMQFNWVADSFFVRTDIAQEIGENGITGVSFGPVLDHRTGAELPDRVQMLLSAIMPCAEISQLSTVTCRLGNEEALAVRALFPKEESVSDQGKKTVLPPDLMEKIRKERERFAVIPFCGRVKYHQPSSLALIGENLKEAPDLFQTEEWFGSGAAAFRLTLASHRFATLVRKRRWKGLVFHRATQSGFSERAEIGAFR